MAHHPAKRQKESARSHAEQWEWRPVWEKRQQREKYNLQIWLVKEKSWLDFPISRGINRQVTVRGKIKWNILKQVSVILYQNPHKKEISFAWPYMHLQLTIQYSLIYYILNKICLNLVLISHILKSLVNTLDHFFNYWVHFWKKCSLKLDEWFYKQLHSYQKQSSKCYYL